MRCRNEKTNQMTLHEEEHTSQATQLRKATHEANEDAMTCVILLVVHFLFSSFHRIPVPTVSAIALFAHNFHLLLVAWVFG